MIKQWSPSRLFQYEACPLSAKYKYVDKVPEPGPKGAALVRGEELHGHLEHFIKGWREDLDPKVAKMSKVATELREGFKRGEVHVEIELAITREWKVTKWVAPDTWGRFKLDVIVKSGNKGRVIDWKTGKYKPDGDYADQLNAYSTAALSVTPELEEMSSCLIFVDHTDVPVERPEGSVVRSKLAEQQEYWSDRVARMERDSVFAPRPGFACRWCPYRKSAGGPCEF